MPNLKIEYLKKEELRPYANNAKIHTGEQVEQIKNSIKQFSFNDPIAIWGDCEVVEGHGRLLAVMEMDDVKEVPVIRLDHLTDEQRKAYALVHNKLTMNTDFDFDLLGIELDGIGNIDMTDFGFDDKVGEYIDNFFSAGEDNQIERVGDYDEEHELIVKTHRKGKYDALITYLKKNEIEYIEND